jgi:hypothetical protein
MKAGEWALRPTGDGALAGAEHVGKAPSRVCRLYDVADELLLA